MKKFEIVLSSFVLALVLVLPLSSTTKSTLLAVSETSDQVIELNYDYPAHIEILNDTDFETLNFEGDGTEALPYLIKDYIISEQSYFTGIKIYNTTKFCVITNCTIGLFNMGIFLRNASNVAVSNNIFNSCPRGIVVNNCSDVEIVQNTLFSCHGGAIYIFESPSIVIKDNSIEYSSFIGMGIYYSPSCLINNNTLEYCYKGIVVYDSPGSIFTDNLLTFGGITFNSDNHQLEDYLTYILENNTLNSEQIGFFKNTNNLDINEDIYSQIILVNCTNVNVVRIDFSDCITGLIVYYGKDIEVYECVFNYNLEGSIVMFFVENARIDSTAISESDVYPGGILLYGCTESEVRNCTINDCNIGIIFRLSNSCKTWNNRIERCYVAGIIVDESNNCEISNTNCNKTFQPDSAGILVMNSFNCNIVKNIVEDNNAHGIYLYKTNSSTIYSNLIRNNKLYGVYIDQYSSHNTIYWNEFVDNYQAGSSPDVNSQAWDSGENNTWYSKELKEGNFWNEHKGRKPYTIDGDASAQDLFPLRKSPFSTNFIVPVLSISIALIIVNRIRKKRIQ